MPPMPETPTTTRSAAEPVAASAISGHLDTRTAALEVANGLYDTIGGGADLLLVFASFHHRAAFPEAAGALRQTLTPRCTLGVTTEGVLGVDEEREGLAGLAAMAIRMPGVRMHRWTSTPDRPIPISAPDRIPEWIGLDDEFRVAIMMADPFSTPITRLLPALTECGGPDRPVLITGGMASGASQPGHNLLVMDDRVLGGGAVGVSLSGPLTVDCIVSQGCRPIDRPLLITKSRDNVILELGGRRAVDVLKELASELSEHERQLLTQGLLVGTVVDEYKGHFGRGDFLVRNILGLDQQVGGIAVGEHARVGQTIQFHVRDAVTAAEDLHLLLDGQQLKPKPFAALLFTCSGRGQRLFQQPNHDITVIRERLDGVPIAGFFAAGEVGPIGTKSFLHGHTASLALLRSC